MDIEGGEWSVLPDLITSGALCNSVDYWFGEFHHWQHGTANWDYNNDYSPLQKGISKILSASMHCKTKNKFVELDDGAYLLDASSYSLAC